MSINIPRWAFPSFGLRFPFSLKSRKRKKEIQEKKKKPGKGEKEYKEGLEEKGFACLFSCFFREERGGKRRGKLRKKGIKWKEKRDQVKGNAGMSL